ncbi:hypothetical protein COX03_01290 [Candidatus Woesebacteria bacterium CG22_combo_CG10-13_8_21_14_all_39_10]|uniref:DUF6922 domain-containing protein n=1 Tax=Candidatus Woesebacteria bacterium CG22_combo_CG10-13_8_21_14_all_39_10 TaxID=1975059 RepID=A0A2H0BJB9_9BACT|nr:MAG: hypothetical protein COX03_01290 [Candidatus Woesebacteria bacterium CG22_combo_CG10-13_8_21_14_all_39_10]
MTSKLPRKFYRYFWDVDPTKVNLHRGADFVVKRILEHGQTADLRWVVNRYGTGAIKQVLFKYRDLSRKTGLFWSHILDIPKDKIKCLQIPYHPIPFGV